MVHTSISTTAQKEISLDVIKHAAGWLGQSRVLANFYNRPVINPKNFSDTVLG